MREIFKGLFNYIDGRSTLSIVIEFSFVLLLFLSSMLLIYKGAKNRRVIFILSLVFIAILLTFSLGLNILCVLLAVIFSWLVGAVVGLYGKNLRKTLESTFNAVRTSSTISVDEKEKLISTLANTCVYLGKHKVGALITIERDDSLNSIIEKAIPIEGRVTEEILTTIFTVGTACHDGAVIIQGNKLMCAAAYLPSTDKYDLPKSLGTRHRAAIGVSERYDAITLVVSEETGAISYTIDGNIFLNVDKEKLIEELNTYIRIN